MVARTREVIAGSVYGVVMIFFAVLGGIQVFGVLGVVLGPVVIAITQAIIEIIRETNRSAQATVT